MSNARALQVLNESGLEGADATTCLRVFTLRSSDDVAAVVDGLRAVTAGMSLREEASYLAERFGQDAMRAAGALIARY